VTATDITGNALFAESTNLAKNMAESVSCFPAKVNFFLRSHQM